jgi:hypothetical protein
MSDMKINAKSQLNKLDGVTLDVNGEGAMYAKTATSGESGNVGVVKPDGSTITILTDGTISAVGGGGGGYAPDMDTIDLTDDDKLRLKDATGYVKTDGDQTVGGVKTFTATDVHSQGITVQGTGGNVLPDKYIPVSETGTTHYLPITPPVASGAQFYARDSIEMIHGNASNMNKSEICFTFRTVGDNSITFSADYGQAVRSAYWVDVTNRILWLRYYMVSAISDKAIVRHYNPYTTIGQSQMTPPEGAVWTDYKLQFNQSTQYLTPSDTGWV